MKDYFRALFPLPATNTPSQTSDSSCDFAMLVVSQIGQEVISPTQHFVLLPPWGLPCRDADLVILKQPIGTTLPFVLARCAVSDRRFCAIHRQFYWLLPPRSAWSFDCHVSLNCLYPGGAAALVLVLAHDQQVLICQLCAVSLCWVNDDTLDRRFDRPSLDSEGYPGASGAKRGQLA